MIIFSSIFMTKKDLFLKLARPDNEGVSRWVSVNEFVGEFAELKFGNGGAWCRGSSNLARQYKIEVDKTQTSGNKIDRIRTVGFQDKPQFNQNIRQDIKNHLKKEVCVMLGVNGTSENTKIEIDHKEGLKNNVRVSDLSLQTIDDFQPLCKAANDVKRQICKKCKETDKRFDARIIKGYPKAYYKGGEALSLYGCDGCYQYDPVRYRQEIYKQKD